MTLRSQGFRSREADFRVPLLVTLARGTVHVLPSGLFLAAAAGREQDAGWW